MRNLYCDEKGCKKLVYYIEDGYEGIELAYCKKHGEEFLINVSYPSEIKYLKSRIREIKKHITCQNSKEGHIFPPPPKPKPQKIQDAQNPGVLQYDIATTGSIRLGSGPSHTCTKCGYTYHDPSTMINFNGNSLVNVGFLDWKITTKDSMGLMG